MKQKNKKPEIIVSFEPDPDYEERFLEFVEDVLFWPDLEEDNKDTKAEK